MANIPFLNNAYFAAKVGIGTASATKELEIGTNAAAETEFRMHSDVSGKYFNIQSAGNFTSVKTTGSQNFILDSSGSSGYVTFVTNASERMRINYNGNVGIGTTSPAYKLDINGDFRVKDGSSAIAFNEYSNGATIWLDGSNGDFAGGDYFNISAYGTTDLAFGYAAGTKITMKSDGKLGIGTTSPNAKLTIRGSGLVSQDFFHIEDSGGVRMLEVTSDAAGNSNLQVKDTAGATKSLINSAGNSYLNGGNVGIGTTSPQQKLDVVGRVRASYDTSNYYEIGASSAGGFVVGKSGGVETVNIRTYGDSYFNGGNFGIGTSSPTAKLDVAGTGNFTGLVSGITPVAAANFVTKAYADGLTPGAGVFLPLAGGTMTGITQFNDHTIYGDQVYAKWGAGNDLTIGHNATNSVISNAVGDLYISNHSDDKDIIFECDNGSGASASYLTLDGSTTHAYFSNPGNVGIGTTSPDTKLDIEDSNPFVTIQGSSSSYVNAGVQFISNQASTARGLGNFYYSAHSDVEWFSGLPYGGNDAFVINRNTSYTVPSSQSSPPGIGASAGTLLKVDSAGAIRFNNYSGTNKTGTPTYLIRYRRFR